MDGKGNYTLGIKERIIFPEIDVDKILAGMKEHFKNETVTDIDGVKIDFPDSWVHFRKSNTEPIVRIYAEAGTMEKAEALIADMKKVMNSIIGK